MKKLLTIQEAAIALNVRVSTLEQWIKKNKGPKYFKIGSKIFYNQESILLFKKATKSEIRNNEHYAKTGFRHFSKYKKPQASPNSYLEDFDQINDFENKYRDELVQKKFCTFT